MHTPKNRLQRTRSERALGLPASRNRAAEPGPSGSKFELPVDAVPSEGASK